MGQTATFRIWRGNGHEGTFTDYATEVTEGMVVLDAVHQIQAHQAHDLAVRWNCKAGKCGSCSAEVNGHPRLMCMTRLNQLNLAKPVTIEPMKAFPPIKDLVTDVSFNFRAKKSIKPFKPRPPDAPDGTWRMAQADVERVQEFRKCIECFLCQDVCHVLRDHRLFDEFVGPRHMIYAAVLEMLLLALTDQFDDDLLTAHDEAVQVAARLRDEYERAYYTGIIWERRAKARLRRASPAVFPHVYGWLREAMVWYERAESFRPAGNDDALLRWNACARLIMRDRRLAPAPEDRAEPLLLE